MKIRFMLAIAVAGLLLSSVSAVAVPAPNRTGDYTRENTTGHYSWRVVDPDPSGLNCRMAKRFQYIDYGSMEAPDELYENFAHNIGEWSIVATFPPGEALQVQTSNGRNPNFLVDRQGKFWMAVASKQRGSRMCFVRSNRHFIQPF